MLLVFFVVGENEGLWIKYPDSDAPSDFFALIPHPLHNTLIPFFTRETPRNCDVTVGRHFNTHSFGHPCDLFRGVQSNAIVFFSSTLCVTRKRYSGGFSTGYEIPKNACREGRDSAFSETPLKFFCPDPNPRVRPGKATLRRHDNQRETCRLGWWQITAHDSPGNTPYSSKPCSKSLGLSCPLTFSATRPFWTVAFRIFRLYRLYS